MPRSLMLSACAVLAGAFLAGCTTPTARQDQSSPFYAVPVGTTVELHRELSIPPGATRAWIQHGKVVRGINSYEPNCNIEVTIRDEERTQVVAPGVFRVRRTQSYFEWVVQAAEPIRVASSQDDGGNSMVYQGYHLWLENPEQPNVRRLSCRGVFDDLGQANPPSIDEIRAALGEVATLHLP